MPVTSGDLIGGTPQRLKWVIVSGRLQSGVDIEDRDSLLDRMEGRR